MLSKHRSLAVIVLVAAVPATTALAQAGAGKTDKATGGGQVLLSSDDVKRSTIAFTAQNTTPGDSAGKGQVQFIDRSAGAGQNQVKYHGVVDCVIVEGNRAQIAGYRKGAEDPQDEGSRFELTVVDNGEPNQGNDMILFDNTEVDGRCESDDSDNDDEPELALAKGNAQVRDGDGANMFPEDENDSPAAALTSALGF